LARWLATAWFMWPRMESVWALAWASGGLALVERGDGHIVGGLFGVEVLLGDELVVVEGLGAVVVELFCSRSALAWAMLASAVFSAAM
jgi:hypothetical protein